MNQGSDLGEALAPGAASGLSSGASTVSIGASSGRDAAERSRRHVGTVSVTSRPDD